MKLHDQRTDKSRAFLVKIAHRMNDAATAEAVLKLAMSDYKADDSGAFAHELSLPCGSAEDTILSRVYFNGQREKLAADTAEAIDERIGVYETLYGIDGDFSLKNVWMNEKTAGLRFAELLPGYLVIDAEGLEKAAAAFEKKYLQLDMQDRHTFANNFTKTAAAWGCTESNDALRTYGGRKECDFAVLREHLGFRKAACMRSGQSTEFYDTLLNTLPADKKYIGSRQEKIALAQYIHAGDVKHGFDAPAYDRKLPDAWHAVFNSEKTAEESSGFGAEDHRKAPNNMSKADILARYGDDALDAVTNFDGSINISKLKNVMNMAGSETKDKGSRADG